MSGVDRLVSRVKRARVQEDQARPRTVADCADRIEQLESRIRQLEDFKNKPVIAIGSAIALAVAAKLAGVA